MVLCLLLGRLESSAADDDGLVVDNIITELGTAISHVSDDEAGKASKCR